MRPEVFAVTLGSAGDVGVQLKALELTRALLAAQPEGQHTAEEVRVVLQQLIGNFVLHNDSGCR